MIRLQSLCLIFAFLWMGFVKCDECEFANINYKDMIRGMDGIVQSSDPLRIDLMKASLPTLEYSLINATFEGLKNCVIINQYCDQNKMTFKYHLRCPRLLLQYLYKADGKLANLLIEGHGTGKAEIIDYVIMFEGQYESVLGTDQLLRPIIKEIKYETDPKGIIKYEIKNLYQGDAVREAKANKYFNDNWRKMEKNMRTPILDDFMELFIENFNNYSKYQ